ESMLPHSTFLRFPDEEKNRIIALPAYLGDGFSVAGVKWISSFLGNLERGIERASAVVILNSTETGRPQAIIEGSAISARRTAASGALAARVLHSDATGLGLIGCGPINFEVARFVLAALPGVESFLVFDKDENKARQFKDKCLELSDKVEVGLAPDAETVLRNCPLTSLATTAISPHLNDLSQSPPQSTILHISLRDFAPEVILSCDNVVDDIDHVCRAQTSAHLAEQLTGGRDFIRCTLGDILLDRAPARDSRPGTTIFSPFGLGILDLAVAHFLYEQAMEKGLGTVVESFFPETWTNRTNDRR
ncbi:MAG TPA: 2,3-diaminopropionate biosynthesis protein SbnB, partial [Pyrinomonadaceae bacterium]|nr:2,3-diaminopropionate biosynthesis protein SbnB [Pyrinomonadaceae bacterium]